MAFEEQVTLYGLVSANAVLYSILVLGIVRTRASRPEVSNIAEAFALLERALRENFHNLPDGFTWGEAVARMRSARPEIDWEAMEHALRGYEVYRYGGLELGETDPREVLRLAALLGKGSRFVRRP